MAVRFFRKSSGLELAQLAQDQKSSKPKHLAELADNERFRSYEKAKTDKLKS